MQVRRKGCTSVELKSPPPPRELRLGRGALADVRLAAALLRWRGCAAPDCGERGAAAMLHCHVNVRSSEGGGELLCARELLSVFCAWLQFEHVAASLARGCGVTVGVRRSMPRGPSFPLATSRGRREDTGRCAFYALRYPDLGAPPRERSFYLVQSRAVEIRPRSL